MCVCALLAGQNSLNFIYFPIAKEFSIHFFMQREDVAQSSSSAYHKHILPSCLQCSPVACHSFFFPFFLVLLQFTLSSLEKIVIQMLNFQMAWIGTFIWICNLFKLEEQAKGYIVVFHEIAF